MGGASFVKKLPNFYFTSIEIVFCSFDFFFGKSCSRNFAAPIRHPITSMDLVYTAQAITRSVETMSTV